MVIKDIQNYGDIRTQLRAYICYLFSRNIPNKVPELNQDAIVYGLKKMRREIEVFDALYLLNQQGVQVIDTISKNPTYRKGIGEKRSNRAYYYRAAREKKCILTDPYPSLLNGNLTVTASYPIYNDKNELKYIACIDISLIDALSIIKGTNILPLFNSMNKITYSIFAICLGIISFMLFIKGILSITEVHHLDIKEIFEATILITLSIAIYDLVKAIFEEEVIGSYKKDENSSLNIHKTMTKFLGSIIIALAIEALMLVFKFAITGPEKIVYAVYLIAGVTMLLVGLALYIKFVGGVDKANEANSNR